MTTRPKPKTRPPKRRRYATLRPTLGPKTYRAAMAFQRPPEALSGVFTMASVNTEPGSGGAMAPPAGAMLNPTEYRALIRERYRVNPAASQHFAIYALRLYGRPHHQALTITGPFAGEARAILEAIAHHRLTPTPKDRKGTQSP